MERIQFAVSAKTARLIGRENISDVDSAIIELIKNSYDADAKCVFVGFNIPFPSVPQLILFELATKVFGESGLSPLFDFYERTEKGFLKKKGLSVDAEKHLEALLYSKNRILIMDNGHGMDTTALRSAWMNIGTSDKEKQRVSPEGRIKTGAKGIGRFALDKLSTQTTVYTKHKDDVLLKWSINWNQFETASLLDEVSATLEPYEGDFKSLAQRIAEKQIKSFDNYCWDTGTLIVLTPTRETWSKKYFEKVNRNLKSIFPYTNDTLFDIYIYNRFFPEYSSINERFSLQDSEYDYKIDANFDGKDRLSITLYRNEVDTRKIKVKLVIEEKEFELQLSDFWKREAFKAECYNRADYAKAFTWNFSASKLLKIGSDVLSEVGPFSAEMYFLKNANSPIDIIKQVVIARRKDILNNYSGIKLYRDGFKVRPYGEEGPSFDWLGLGIRAQKSPAAVSHPSGSWRVLPYQIIGAVRISRDDNPNLVDMANREGLAINDSYRVFVSLFDKIIETFEADRQKVYREYALWNKSKENEISKAAEVVESVRAKKEKSKAEAAEKEDSTENDTETSNSYTNTEYESAVSYLEAENERQRRANQTMMLFSSAGVMTNTFAHEIGRIATNTGSRMMHLRATVKLLIGEDGYTGHPDLDPLPLIDEAEKTDKLLESWLDVIMQGVDNSKFDKSSVHPQELIQEIIDLWTPLLDKKFIHVNPIYRDLSEDSVLNISEVDIHIIMNNFFLNSAWFLEKAKVERREITITVSDEKGMIILLLENNGPPLDPVFDNNPDRIFEAGVSIKNIEKNEGTGLGLWIAKTIVDNNSGEIHPIRNEEGFGLRVTLPK